jgi:hypothetical protein
VGDILAWKLGGRLTIPHSKRNNMLQVVTQDLKLASLFEHDNERSLSVSGRKFFD